MIMVPVGLAAFRLSTSALAFSLSDMLAVLSSVATDAGSERSRSFWEFAMTLLKGSSAGERNRDARFLRRLDGSFSVFLTRSSISS